MNKTIEVKKMNKSVISIYLAIDLEDTPIPEWIDDNVEDAMEM